MLSDERIANLASAHMPGIWADKVRTAIKHALIEDRAQREEAVEALALAAYKLVGYHDTIIAIGDAAVHEALDDLDNCLAPFLPGLIRASK